MGTDFRLSCMPAATITDDRRRQLHEIVDQMEEEKYPEIVWDMMEYEDFDDPREILHKHVDLLPDPNSQRDIVSFGLPHMPYHMTSMGGLSSGNAPTDVYETFVVFEDCDVIFDQLEKWATEDAVASSPDSNFSD